MAAGGETTCVARESRNRCRWGGAHPAGIVYYPNFFDLVRRRHPELLRGWETPFADIFRQDNIGLPVIEAHGRFLAPALYDDDLAVDTAVAEAHPRLSPGAHRAARGRARRRGPRRAWLAAHRPRRPPRRHPRAPPRRVRRLVTRRPRLTPPPIPPPRGAPGRRTTTPPRRCPPTAVPPPEPNAIEPVRRSHSLLAGCRAHSAQPPGSYLAAPTVATRARANGPAAPPRIWR